MPFLPRLALLLVGLLLGSCATSPPPPAQRFPEITFGQHQPFRFQASEVEVVREYTAPLTPPNVDHLFPASPTAIAERWARDRLQPMGGPWRMRYIVKRASVVEVQLPRTPGIRGAFTNDQAQRYDAILEVQIELRNDRGFRDGVVDARVERSQSVPEDITPAGRERVWFQMGEALGADLNAELERNIRSALPRFFAF